MIEIGTPTGLCDVDGMEIRLGDKLKAIKGPWTIKPFDKLTVEVIYHSGFFCFLWSDKYRNPGPILASHNWKIIP